ncbi:MAG: long-chain fatty acid--CoA ligase [Ginsengibacter sp.]
MTIPTRLFDCIELHLKNDPGRILLAGKENGTWKKYTVKDVSDIVDRLSAGLLKMGLGNGDNSPEGRDKIAVISRNRPEWILLDLAVQQIGAVLTPVYPTINESELEFVMKDAAVKVVFVSDKELYKKINGIRPRLPELKEIYSFDNVSDVKHWEEILTPANDALISQVKDISSNIKYEDLATIIYTSGTTGKPKGVMLSHKNILSNVLDSTPYFPPGENMKALSFLPLNHIFERMVSYLYLFLGTTIYYAESMETIGENLKEVQPEMFTTVPRLLEKVYDKIIEKGKELTGIKRRLFFWAHGLATKFEINKKQGIFYKLQLSIANKLIFNKWREALGGHIKCIVSGGAACQVRLIRIFTAAQITVMEGYGLTETSPVISVNRYQEEDRMFGTVGPLIENVEVIIADDGEILCKGPNVMIGYYKRPDLTAEVIEDGWFKTGDIGMMINNKFLKITDRKKEMFKTSGGKYVAPVVVENRCKESPFIENVMVTGADEKYVGALITPSFVALKKWCAEKNITCNKNEEIIINPQVRELFKNEVEQFNEGFNHVEQIKKFELLPREWSVETGELTPKLSLKRKVILEKYKDAVKRIYE